MEKLMNFIVKKCWKFEAFRNEVAKQIKETPTRFALENLKKLYTVKKGVIVLHDVDTNPLIFMNKEEFMAAIPSDKPAETKPRRTSRKKKDVVGVAKDN